MRDNSKFWTKISRKYARDAISDVPAYEYTLDRTKSYLGVGDRVLELGCGTGSTALRLAGSVGHLVATDFSEGMIEIAREKIADSEDANIEARVATPADITDGTYDAVLGFNLFHLFEDVDGALADVAGLVKPGGFFISKTVCAFSGQTPLKYRLMFSLIKPAQWLGKAPFVRFDPIDVWERRIEAAGFEIVETGNHPVAPPSRYVVAGRV